MGGLGDAGAVGQVCEWCGRLTGAGEWRPKEALQQTAMCSSCGLDKAPRNREPSDPSLVQIAPEIGERLYASHGGGHQGPDNVTTSHIGCELPGGIKASLQLLWEPPALGFDH